jgi:Fe-S cluster biogenesis protein NfuA
MLRDRIKRFLKRQVKRVLGRGEASSGAASAPVGPVVVAPTPVAAPASPAAEPVAAPASPAAEPVVAPASPDPVDAVRAALEALRPALQAGGGDAELVRVSGGAVVVRLTGACGASASARQSTALALEAALIADVAAVQSVALELAS